MSLIITNRKISLLWLTMLVSLCYTSFSAQNSALFEQAKEQYKAEKYQEAISNWSKIVESGSHSAALYFNLGNAHYKLNQIGPSIYYYEKGLRLDPNYADIKNNLAFAQNATIDAIEPLPETVFSKWYKSISGITNYNGWAILSVSCSFAFVILFLLYYYSFSERRKRLLFVGSLLSLFLLLGAVVFAFKTYDDFTKDRPAIVFAESTEVKSEPSLGSAPAFTLHEGTKVQILQIEDEWLHIIIADGKEGWLPASDVKQL